MIRGVLSTLSTRLPQSLSLKSSTRKNGALLSLSKLLINQQSANFSIIPSVVKTTVHTPQCISVCSSRFLEPNNVLSEQVRTVVKYSLKKGKRKTDDCVTQRFFRLHWGIWVRTMAGRHKKLWKKRAKRRNNLTKHVFCNATQSRMLDKMVNKFWRKPKYYIEDPYEPYHKRENFYLTRTKPWRPEGVDYE